MKVDKGRGEDTAARDASTRRLGVWAAGVIFALVGDNSAFLCGVSHGFR
ncbi:MAG TPA: hypothetical protein VHM69_06660 [Rubrobacter sp.]|nr:hypothetical protein [Rubrobacter sp.]